MKNRLWAESGGILRRLALLALVGIVLVAGCARPTPTPTVAPATVRPTFTAVPPATATIPPSAAPLPSTPTALPGLLSTATPTKAPPTATPKPTAIPALSRPARMSSPEYGMQAFLWLRPEVGSRDVQMVRQAGFGWIKQMFAWKDIEPAKGQFQWGKVDEIVKWMGEQQLNLLVRLDFPPSWAANGQGDNSPPNNYEDYGDYCFAVASRYKGRVRAYEIWNEPNLAKDWGGRAPNAADYVALLKVAYRRIKQADPGAIVISAGLTPTGTGLPVALPDDVYLEQMYQAMGGSSTGYFDALGAHAAGYKAPPEMSPDEVARDPNYGGNRFNCFRRVEDLRRIMVKYGDTDKQMAVTEFGWTSDSIHPAYAWHAVTEEQKAEYLVRAYQYAKANWSPWIGVMSLIYVCDPDWTEQKEEYWWAISYPGYPDFKPRPAYNALKAMPK